MAVPSVKLHLADSSSFSSDSAKPSNEPRMPAARRQTRPGRGSRHEGVLKAKPSAKERQSIHGRRSFCFFRLPSSRFSQSSTPDASGARRQVNGRPAPFPRFRASPVLPAFLRIECSSDLAASPPRASVPRLLCQIPSVHRIRSSILQYAPQDSHQRRMITPLHPYTMSWHHAYL